MAPATRRSSGFGSNANSPSNLDHILEHFNQFKRKHITQNRDIIKTNALAQLRIKELEEKVLGLEAEKTQFELEKHRMKTKLERAEKAIICIRQGWQFIGAGITAMASIDGFENVTEQKQENTPSSVLHSLQHHQQQAHLRPSVRVVLDPNALPAGVARNVARPPEADLADLAEEESMAMEEECQMTENDHNFGPLSDHRIDYQVDNQGQITLEQEENTEDADSDQGDFGDAVSFAGDGEETVRLQTNLSEAPEHEEDSSVMQSQSDAKQRSNFYLERTSSSDGQKNRAIQRMTSMDSLSSFADDEEIELSTDDERESGILPPNRAPTPVNNGPTKMQNGTIRARTPRKRKTPSSPEDSRGLPSYSTINPHQHDIISASQSEAEVDEEDEENSSNSSNGIRASRRSSMRDKKSINYALPKLNTKMRKPDPAELIPAVGGSQKKKRQGSMQTAMNDEDESEMNGGEGAETEEQPRRRTLKGKNEAASTGNLREIRKLHQEKAQHDQSFSPDHKQEQQEAEQESESTQKEEEQQNFSPRRRSSRQSLRRRSSSSMTSENGGSNKADQALKSDEGRNQREGSFSPEDRKVVQRKEDQVEHTLPGMQKPRQSISKLSHPTNGTATPKWRPMSGGMNHSSSSSSSSLGLGTNGNGTPIPKPTIRNGQQGTIKALNKAAGRIQKPTSHVSGLTNTNSTQQPQQQKRIAATFSNGSRATSDAQTGKSDSQKRILGSSAKANSTARSVSSSSAVSSASSSSLNVNGSASQSTAGDPIKRNSLHAAMTWNDISSASHQS